MPAQGYTDVPCTGVLEAITSRGLCLMVGPSGGLGCYLSGTAMWTIQQEDLGREEGAPGVQKNATLDVRFTKR